MGLAIMVSSYSIEVVMPTYNGIDFVEAQIASIYNQTLRPSKLIIRDDFSTDGTTQLLAKLAVKYQNWIKILPSYENIGCTSSIDLLLSSTCAPYVALADQDDIWLPHKLELSFNHIVALEARVTSSIPLLIHSDLQLVGENLNDLGETYSQRQCLKPYLDSPSMIALTNVVTGCTILCNRALLDVALPLPVDALVHDWWLALVSSVFGKIVYISDTPILYRQHEKNSIGARGLGLNYWLTRLYSWLCYSSSGGHTLDAIHQMEYFYSRYHIKVSCLPDLIRLSRVHRLTSLLNTPFSLWPCKHGILRTLAFYFWFFRFRALL